MDASTPQCYESVDIGFKPIIGDWQRFDTEDIKEKKPQSFISSLLRDLFTIGLANKITQLWSKMYFSYVKMSKHKYDG